MNRERVLIVEDEKLIRWSIQARLKERGYGVLEADSGKNAFLQLASEDVDLVLLDYRLPDTTGLEILERVRRDSPEIAVVMMTAYGTVENAVEAMKLGAFDYLTKPVDLEQLATVVERALETTRLRREVHRLRGQERERQGSARLIGNSRPMQRVAELISKVSASQAVTVLLEGESGTGKDLAAKAIHYGSSRADRPFVNITCSALTETLLESELFGHERGAFTDARVQKKGLLEVADGGTAFLDEIGEMGLAMQAKMLRFLEEKTFKRVGGTRDIHVDVRIVAATNRVLEEAVAGGAFRADLFYRLKVIPIVMPPLREHPEDVPLLVRHFLDHYNRELRKNTQSVAPDAMARLIRHGWPGNVRELRNVIERVLILENREQIELADLPANLRTDGADPARAAGVETGGRATLEDLERGAIRRALESTDHNQVRAAKLLGITRDTLRYRMKKFGLLGAAK